MNCIKINRLVRGASLSVLIASAGLAAAANAGLVGVDVNQTPIAATADASTQSEFTADAKLSGAPDVEVSGVEGAAVEVGDVESVGVEAVKAHPIKPELVETVEYVVEAPVEETVAQPLDAASLLGTRAESTPGDSSVLGLSQLAKVAGSLLFVLLLILVLAKVAQRFGPGSLKAGNAMRVIEALPVSQKERLLLIEVHQSQYLLSVGAGGSRLLTEVARPEQSAAMGEGFAGAEEQALDQLLDEYRQETRFANSDAAAGEAAIEQAHDSAAGDPLFEEELAKASFNKTFTVLSGGEQLAVSPGQEEAGTGRGNHS